MANAQLLTSSTGPLPRVFLDISIGLQILERQTLMEGLLSGGESAGRVVIKLFANVVPRTAHNFRWLKAS